MRPLNELAPPGGAERGRPRLWHHDYLHLAPIARDLGLRLPALADGLGAKSVLDLGSGGSPYRGLFPSPTGLYVRLDVDPARRPDVAGRAERLPFREGAFDAVIATQILGLVDDPRAVAREIARVLRPGGRAIVTLPAAWPYDAAAVEHRFGAPELRELFSALEVAEIVPEGGMLSLPFALGNGAIREGVRALERRLGPAARIARAPAALFYALGNGAGALLVALSRGGPLSAFLGYLDRRLPMNFLVVASRRR